MNRAELRNHVRFLTLIEPHEVSDAEIDGLLAEAYNNLSTRADWVWSYLAKNEHVGAGSIVIRLENPDIDWSRSGWVVDNVIDRESGRDLRLISVEQAHRLTDGRLHRGDPEFYHITYERHSARIVLHPTPTRAMEYRVVWRHGLKWRDNEEPPFHISFHEILADWAIQRIWEREEDMDKAEQYRLRYEARLIDMMRFYNEAGSDRPRIFGEFQHSYPVPGR